MDSGSATLERLNRWLDSCQTKWWTQYFILECLHSVSNQFCVHFVILGSQNILNHGQPWQTATGFIVQQSPIFCNLLVIFSVKAAEYGFNDIQSANIFPDVTCCYFPRKPLTVKLWNICILRLNETYSMKHSDKKCYVRIHRNPLCIYVHLWYICHLSNLFSWIGFLYFKLW